MISRLTKEDENKQRHQKDPLLTSFGTYVNKKSKL